MESRSLMKTAAFSLLALLCLAGFLTGTPGGPLATMARGVIDRRGEALESYRSSLTDVVVTFSLMKGSPGVSPHAGLLGQLDDPLAFSFPAATAAGVFAGVTSIFLILAGPVGFALLAMMFAFLAVIPHVERDRKLRNGAMALGTSAWVFMAAIPLAVLTSGGLERIYTGPLRLAAEHKMESFAEDGRELAETGGEARDVILLVKGLSNYIWFGSASWPFDVIVLPVLLSWFYYRLGILLANTLFGSLHLQRLGSALQGALGRTR